MVHRCFMLLFYHQEIFPPTGRIQGEFPEFLDVHRFFTIYQIFMVIFLEFFMYLAGRNSNYEKGDGLPGCPVPYLADFFCEVSLVKGGMWSVAGLGEVAYPNPMP